MVAGFVPNQDKMFTKFTTAPICDLEQLNLYSNTTEAHGYGSI